MNGAPPETASPDSAAQIVAMLDAMLLLTRKSTMETSAAEAKDLSAAVLSYAQAIVVLDPALNQEGIPLEHEIALKDMELSANERIEKAKATAAAPTPKKKRLRRTNDGYEVEG